MNELDVLFVPLTNLIGMFHTREYNPDLMQVLSLAFRRRDFRRRFKREYGFYDPEDKIKVIQAAYKAGYVLEFSGELPCKVASLRKMRRYHDRNETAK